VTVPRYHAPVWDEPLVMEIGAPGRRGVLFEEVKPEIRALVGDPEFLVPEALRRATLPQLPELSEPEVLRHYLHLSQETLGMMGVSLFGTCTMKYNPRLAWELVGRPEITEVHPQQDDDTVQGVLAIVHGLDLILRGLSGMDQFVFQPGGGAPAVITRAFHAARGELAQRDEIVTTIQAHPCNPATAAAAGFKVVTLPLEEKGYPSLDALKAAVSERTASLMVNNPDDMGIYNPEIDKWVEVIHDAGGLCFYDHANFNGVMGKIKAGDLGFDACMYMLHKTFGAPKAGGGPAVGAYGCRAEIARVLPVPVVVKEGERYRLDRDRPESIGKVREFWGNVPQLVYAYTWSRAMGGERINEASDISVLANNYMEKRLLAIRGITKSHPHLIAPRMEMTRFSLETLERETGISVVDVQNRMVDFGIDAFWLSHEPWIVPQPFTPEAGEMWSKEDIDRWIDVLAHVIEEAYTNPEIVRSAPHNQAIRRLNAVDLDDPANWATTWRAYRRKSGARSDGEPEPTPAGHATISRE
jgi:glycine dehydrogenase subunit 2